MTGRPHLLIIGVSVVVVVVAVVVGDDGCDDDIDAAAVADVIGDLLSSIHDVVAIHNITLADCCLCFSGQGAVTVVCCWKTTVDIDLAFVVVVIIIVL